MTTLIKQTKKLTKIINYSHTYSFRKTITQDKTKQKKMKIKIIIKTNNRDAMWLIISNAERQLKSTTNKSRPLINKL